MRVEYIQPVCPYCYRGLFFTTTRGDCNDGYWCWTHGDIEARLVRYAKCEHEEGRVLLTVPYETCTDLRVS